MNRLNFALSLRENKLPEFKADIVALIRPRRQPTPRARRGRLRLR